MSGAAIGLAIRAEWTKLRTVAGPVWLLLAVIVATVALSALAAGSVSCTAVECGIDRTRLSLTGIQLGQAVVAVLAVMVVGNEYSSGMIRTTLAAVPRRSVLLAAKALVLSGPVLVAGLIAVAGSLVAGHALLPLSWTDGATMRAAFGSVLYLALIGLMSLGIATAVRDSATGAGLVLGLLYLFPILASVVSNEHWHRHVQQIGPATAGLAIQATVGLANLPISPWHGLGVLALWAAGALMLGGAALGLRDA
jgi:ABC-2 type transport system permease protein